MCAGLVAVWAFIGAGIILEAARTVTPVINAVDQEMTEDSFIASGSVEIAWEDYRIYADYAEYNFKTKEIIAQGRVTMTSNETVLSGDKLSFNLETRKGVMYDTFGQMSPAIRYKTDKLEQVDDQTLKFKKLEFTSCAQCTPRWKITCSKGKIKKEKYIEMTHALVKVKNVPVFYIPYMRYPVNSDGKATGFLFPKIGQSDLRGFFLLNSFFWNIRSNIDLTLSFDYYAKAGIGAAGEFRYLFPAMEGNVYYYYFQYKKDSKLYDDVIDRLMKQGKEGSEIELPQGEYLLKMTHRQALPFLNSRLIIDMDKQSDANFLRLFSNDFFSVLARTSRSSISLTSSLASNVRLGGMVSWNDTYYTFNNSSRSLNYLPQVNLNWNQQRIWKVPGYFSLDSSFSAVERQGKSYDEDGDLYATDTRTQRFTFSPIYSVNLVREPWASAQLDLTSRHSIYFKSKDPETQKIVDKKLHLYYHVAELTFTGPTFYKIFNVGRSRMKHLIMPRINMRYSTEVDDELRSRLIPLDNFDYPLFSYIGFQLTSRLFFKGATDQSAQEFLSYTISQDYYFDAKLAHRDRMIDGEYPAFSELKNTLRITPMKFLSLEARASLSHYIKGERFLDRFPSINLRIAYFNYKSPISGDFQYNSYINPYASKSYIFNRETIGGSLNFNIPNFPIKLQANMNYDITDKLFRHGTFKLVYDYQCISVNGELKIFNYGDRDEVMFNFGISLGNMGMVKDLMGVNER